jgi:2-keto-4-pentenoate hydratase
MTSKRVEDAAAYLAAARREGRVIETLPESCRPQSLAEGYDVQNAFRAIWPDTVAGWKIGATAPPTMARFGLDHPMYGPFFASNVHSSPARTAAPTQHAMAIESEFAYRFGRDLPARAAPYAREEIIAAIDALIPAFEIVGTRYVQVPYGDAGSVVADCMLNAAMVLGTPVIDWRGLDIPRHPVRLTIDGVVKGEGTGSDALGDPRNVLDWVVEKLRAGGVGLKKGQILSTGTCTGIIPFARGQTAIADFGTLGRVEVCFT